MTMRKKNGKRAGFTLIELLVVITIIGLLMAILIPAVTGALKGAKKSRAMAQIRDLDGAIKRYFAEYGKMPLPVGYNGDGDREGAQPYTGQEQAGIIEVLINANTNLNPKQIVFLDLDPASFLGVDGKPLKTTVEMLAALAAGTPYPDPWGGDYGILMDLNFDEKIIATSGDFPEIRAKVAVFSLGDPAKGYTPATTPFKTW